MRRTRLKTWAAKDINKPSDESLKIKTKQPKGCLTRIDHLALMMAGQTVTT